MLRRHVGDQACQAKRSDRVLRTRRRHLGRIAVPPVGVVDNIAQIVFGPTCNVGPHNPAVADHLAGCF